MSQSFTVVFSSPNGYATLNRGYALFKGSSSGATACQVKFMFATNRLYLLDDTGQSSIGPLVAGQPGILSNHQCTLDAGASSIAGSGNSITVNVALSFSGYFTGVKRSLGWVADSAGADSGWQQLGIWDTKAQNPWATADSMSPTGATGASGLFTFQYSSAYGYEFLTTGYASFVAATSVASAAEVCNLLYSADKLYLLNDAGNAYLPPLPIGKPGVLSNGQCSLDAGASSISGSGNIWKLNVSIAFSSSFAGWKNIYATASDKTNNSGPWRRIGSWNTGAPLNVAPTADSVTPSSGQGASQIFSFRFSSVNGYGSLNRVYGSVGSSATAAGVCRVKYQRTPAASPAGLYLVDDTGTTSAGPLAPGGAGTLSNGQCTLSAAASSVSGTGNTLTLTLGLTFPQTFGGPRNVYGWAADNNGLTSPWNKLGTWNATAPAISQAADPSAP